MTSLPDLDQMPPEQLRTLDAQLMSKVDTQHRKIHRDETIIEQLTHEIAILKRHKFAKRSKQISPAQGSLLDDLLNTDLEAIEAELTALHPAPALTEPRQQPKRAPLPPQFPRTVIHHEPDNTQCACGCQAQRIGEDVSEKLDYTPGVFTVEQHVRGKWACRQCETLIQALDYSPKRWVALTRYLEDGAVPIDNNQIENLIRRWALGRSSWLFEVAAQRQEGGGDHEPDPVGAYQWA